MTKQERASLKVGDMVERDGIRYRVVEVRPNRIAVQRPERGWVAFQMLVKDTPHFQITEHNKCVQCRQQLTRDNEFIIGTNPYTNEFEYLCRACINEFEYGYDEIEQIWKPA